MHMNPKSVAMLTLLATAALVAAILGDRYAAYAFLAALAVYVVYSIT